MERHLPWSVSQVLPIIAGESLDGYVARVAAAHCLPRLAEITEVGGAEVSNRQHASFCTPEGLEALADCLGVDREVLRHHAPLWSPATRNLNFFGTALPKHQLQFARRRFSPAALTSSPHHRAQWNLRILPFCPETWEYLVERCPNPSCNRIQRWRRTMGIELCDYCAEPLTRAQTTMVSPELREDLAMLVGLVHHDPAQREAARAQLPDRLVAIEAGDLLDLACALAGVVDPGAARPLTLHRLSLNLASNTIVPALAGAARLLRDWPRSLEILLAERINRNAKARGDGNQGASAKFLSRFRSRQLSPAVDGVIAEFIQHCQDGKGRGLTVAQAAKQTGGEVSALVALRRAGQIPSVLALDGQRLYILFDKGTVRQMARRYQPRASLVSAAWQLGIPTYSARELVERGLLAAGHRLPGRTMRLSVQISSLSQLLDTLSKKLEVADHCFSVSLAKLMLRIGGRPKPWAGVLAAIEAGTLEAAIRDGNEPLAQRIMLKSAEVLSSAAFAPTDGENWHGVTITKADTADILNLSISNFSRHCDFLLGPSSDLREIHMEEALSLAKRYISGTELAQRLGVHHLAARHLAIYRGVKVASTGLFDRASAEYLIPELAEGQGNSVLCRKSAEASRHLAPMLMEANIAADGRVKLPRYLRNRLGLVAGGKAIFEETERGIMLRALP